MKNNFTLEDYAVLLKYFSKNHDYTTFSEYQKKSTHDPIILLRHDIDFSTEQGLKMAKIEADLGIKSTFFLLFSSPFYNLLDDDNIHIVRQIRELGHEIGLHYDVSIIEKGNKRDPLSLLNAQASILGELSGCNISSIAMHNPSISGNDIFRNTDYMNVYDDKFVKNMAYFSDSCMAWRNDFIEHLALNNFPSRIQLLIHPILWSEKELNRWDKLDEFILMKIKVMENTGEMVKGMWKKHSGVIENDSRISK
jgi:hypothetical protein